MPMISQSMPQEPICESAGLGAETPQGEITQILGSLRDGEEEALASLVTLVYRELRQTAALLLRKEMPGHTLRATDLVHEAYLRLFDRSGLEWQDRSHFFGSAARAMRRVLVDYARRKNAGKRIPSHELVPLELAAEPTTFLDVDLLALDDALEALAAADARRARIVELRYFAGLTERETAELLGISRNTVTREWRIARLWLRREMRR